MPPFHHHGLRFETLYSAPRVAVLPSAHPLATRPSISVRELFDEPWIVADTDDDVCRDFWLAASHRSDPPLLGAATRSIDKFIQLVAAGEVLGLAPGAPTPPTRWSTASSSSPERPATPSASPRNSPAAPVA